MEDIPHPLKQVLLLADSLHKSVDTLRDLTRVTRELDNSNSPGYVKRALLC